MTHAKVTITVPADLLSAVDSFVREHPGLNRSAVCAEALAGWLQAKQEELMEQYYRHQSPEEQQENARWRELATESAGAVWE